MLASSSVAVVTTSHKRYSASATSVIWVSSPSQLAIVKASRSDTSPSPPLTTSDVVVTATTLSAIAVGAGLSTTIGAANAAAATTRHPLSMSTLLSAAAKWT